MDQLLQKRLLTFCLTISILCAPILSKAQFFIGAKAGGLNTTIQTEIDRGINSKIGYSGGVTLGYSFSDVFTLQPDILYSIKGFSQSYTKTHQITSNANPDTLVDVTNEYDNSLNANYIEMPVLFKFNISLGGGVVPYDSPDGPVNIEIFAGPYASYLFDASKSISVSGTAEYYNPNNESGAKQVEEFTPRGASSFDIRQITITNQGVNDLEVVENLVSQDGTDISRREALGVPAVSEGLSAIDVGVVAGVGLSFEMGESGKLTVNGRYSRGLMTIDDGFFSDREITLDLQQGEYESKALESKEMVNESMGVFVGYQHYMGD